MVLVGTILLSVLIGTFFLSAMLSLITIDVSERISNRAYIIMAISGFLIVLFVVLLLSLLLISLAAAFSIQ